MVNELARTSRKSFGLLALILFATLRGSETPKKLPPQWIVWNIGQGSWLTRVENGHCYHFDAGGEGRFPHQVVRACRGLKNSLTFSHRDWDHISFAKRLEAELPSLVHRTHPAWTWKPNFETRKSNDGSYVFYYKGLLYPGDSPKKFEKLWMHRLPGKVSFLVLAHHGSKTGTSKRLLEKLKIKLAIASARQRKYGHPHKTVRENLKKTGIPLLRTEHWGSIHLLD